MPSLPTPYYEQDGITIYHADCRDILPLLEPGSVDLVLTDPPYGVNIAGWDKEVPYEVLPTLLTVSSGAIAWFGASAMLQTDIANFAEPPERILIWAPKFSLAHTGKKGIFYRWHPVYLWRVPDKHDGPTHDVMTHGTDGRNWWNHPGTKPIKLIRDLVGLSPDGGIVLDPFMGSGTTLRAAKDLGRRAIGIELEERYCEIAAKRLQQAVLPMFAEAAS